MDINLIQIDSSDSRLSLLGMIITSHYLWIGGGYLLQVRISDEGRMEVRKDGTERRNRRNRRNMQFRICRLSR
ncbi:hypothetical protein BC829DRAFT_434066 [Chytridium lagenaria]|nr:hypothetical protein BC829DRAFT_434066 [Chytridium lagenaria]